MTPPLAPRKAPPWWLAAIPCQTCGGDGQVETYIGSYGTSYCKGLADVPCEDCEGSGLMSDYEAARLTRAERRALRYPAPADARRAGR
ncbi:hypothetical protein EYB45_10990 [Erythrobacteraceae bacterium CFH 75059]|uniref:hypothetical protein n=1 Tax=Qipengyuania thermophila TaxID=2509361 RepID=UPI00101EDE61|nr:hypothetical protein [Qipengyuania thermophila]TCD00711.1 hypothetical protein EYB45_10990 [Erythrobacteraceae bacterium CFH 75059]